MVRPIAPEDRVRPRFLALRALGAAACVWSLLPALAAAGPDAGVAASAPRSTNPHLAATLSLFEQGLLEAADEKLREARAFEPNTPADQVQLQLLDGMLRAVSADDDLARAAFRRALSLDPGVALPESATTRVRRVFEEARAEPKRSVATQVVNLSVEGKLEDAEALLAEASAGKNSSRAQSGQLLVLKGLTAVLKGLKSAGPTDEDKARAARKAEKELEVVEARMTATAGAPLNEMESSQQLVLKGLMLVVKGLVKAESGDAAQAKAAFTQALDLDPSAKVPALGTKKTQQAFEAAKAEIPPPPAETRGLTSQVAQLYTDGKLDQAELLLTKTADRKDLTKAETGQLYALKGLLLVLKGLRKAGPDDEQRARVALGTEGQIKAVEDQVAAVAAGPLTPAESAQQKVLGGLLLVVKGLMKAESGDEGQARAAFAQALEVDPEVKLPSLARPKAQQLFDSTKSTSPTPLFEGTRSAASAEAGAKPPSASKAWTSVVPPITGNRPIDATMLGVPASLIGGFVGGGLSLAWCRCAERATPLQRLSVGTAAGLGIGIGAWAAVAQGQLDREWPAQLAALLAIPVGAAMGMAAYQLDVWGIGSPVNWVIVGAVPLAVGVLGSELAAGVQERPRGARAAVQWRVIPGWSARTGAATLEIAGVF